MGRPNKGPTSVNKEEQEAEVYQQIDANTSPSTSASSQLHGLDLSKYRQPQLVAALDRLTSFTYAGSLLLKPAMKIMWRSALYQDSEVRLNELLSKLKGSSPVTQPPSDTQERAQQQQAEQASSSSSRAQQQQPRSLAQRIIHFFTVGLPMAIFVGLAYGLVNFLTCIYSDISTVASTSSFLFSQAKEDLNYYMAHPESRPTKDEAVDAWTAQIIGPYTKTIVQRKLGPFGFVSGPISNVVQSVVKRFARTSATELENYAKKYKKFNPFKTEAEAASGQ